MDENNKNNTETPEAIEGDKLINSFTNEIYKVYKKAKIDRDDNDICILNAFLMALKEVHKEIFDEQTAVKKKNATIIFLSYQLNGNMEFEMILYARCL